MMTDQQIRALLAKLFTIVLLVFISVLIFLLMVDKMSFATFKISFTIVTSLLTGTVGAIFGYYFGLRVVERRDNSRHQ